MSSRTYIIPGEDLTFSEKSEYRWRALAAGIKRAIGLGIGEWNSNEFPTPDPARKGEPDFNDVLNRIKGGFWPRSQDVREFQPILDAGTALDQWNTPALAAAGTEYSCFQAIVAPAIGLRVKKLVVWYKVQILTVPLPVSRLIFRRTNATGTVMVQFDLEQLSAGQRLDGYFTEPVIWDNNMPYAINVMAKGMPAAPTGAISEIVLGNFVFEVAGSVNV